VCVLKTDDSEENIASIFMVEEKRERKNVRRFLKERTMRHVPEDVILLNPYYVDDKIKIIYVYM
jgi:hypothetical protein